LTHFVLSAKRRQKIVTQSEKEELTQAHEHLAYWQRQLRLDYMDIDIVLMRTNEKRGVYADCMEAPSYHHQKIKIRHPDDRSDTDRGVFRFDLEVCIVHELLHTKEFPWRDHPKTKEVLDKDEWLKQLHEDSIDAVAEALVRARRGITR